MTSDGPFGDYNIGVGFSDNVILGISLAGFCLLGYSKFSSWKEAQCLSLQMMKE